MKKLLFFISLLALTATCKTHSQNTFIRNQNVIQDHAKLFSELEVSCLTKKIVNYEASSSNEICVFTLDSLPKNYSALEYASKVGNELGVGKKEKNNGLIILISKFDRQLSIATGNETEKVLTDAYCKTVIDSIIVPKFKSSLYYQGIDKAIDSIIKNWEQK